MKVKIINERESSIARILLKNDQTLITQAGTLVAMRGNVSISTSFRRSSAKGKSSNTKIIATESLFLTEFCGLNDTNEVLLASAMIGNIVVHSIKKYKLVVVASAYLACDGTMTLFFGIPEIKFPSENQTLTLLSLTGKGEVLLNGLGAIYLIEVEEEYWVKVEHLVAFENSLKYEVKELKEKWWQKPKIFIKFRGEGKLYCQTHQGKNWGYLIAKKLKSK
ncbi:TIGR00266 family protein [Crocosphaera sp.]|uniref:TIGR00266 family protein n=1 Tax=Crocosphaera sp. TaxID=2729996 RepID=UPI00262192B9|nr:TIGR00266 family protein [Crocosphaera sp.]MDJ0579900.1 TIGR00266 family protein [Crocosphaera sp.]